MPVRHAERLNNLRPGDLKAFLADLGPRGDQVPMLYSGARMLRYISAWARGARRPASKQLADLAARNLGLLERVIGRNLDISARNAPGARGGGWLLGS